MGFALVQACHFTLLVRPICCNVQDKALGKQVREMRQKLNNAAIALS